MKTLVYPGFPTDLQQPFSVLLTQAIGSSMITDTVYSARFKHIDEIRRMNADARVEGRSAILSGPTPLEAATVRASDLRAGAALVLAGLLLTEKRKFRRFSILNVDIVHLLKNFEGLVRKFAK